MNALGVINGKELSSMDKADCLTWLAMLPEQSVDLFVFSPPYEKARAYLELGEDLRIARGTEEWVAWMVEVIKAALRVCRGLVVCVCEGQTKAYRYSAGPLLLAADLHRAGIHLRKPPIYHRVGIPGSGGPDWWRNDYEFCLVFSNGGKLPWSDSTATGHPPRWAPGGAMSHRLADGARVNEWGGSGKNTFRMVDGSLKQQTGREARPGEKTKAEVEGTKEAAPVLFEGGEPAPSECNLLWDKGGYTRDKNGEPKPGHGRPKKASSKTRRDKEMRQYDPPVLANPGNVVECQLSFEELARMILHYANITHAEPNKILQSLWGRSGEEALGQWLFGIHATLLGSSVLRPEMYGAGIPRTISGGLPFLPCSLSTQDGRSEVLQSEVLRGRHSGRHARGASEGDGSLCGVEENRQEGVRGLWSDGETSGSPQGRKPHQQSAGESPSPVSVVPSQTAYEASGNLPNLWQASEAVQGLWDALRHALPTLQEVWRSAPFETQRRSLLPCLESSDVIRCQVGGGQMGSDLAHENEAPYPEQLVEPFVRCFCPPNGVVADPFAGSGTTGAVALRWGRRFIGCDLRASQVELSQRRLAEHATMFDTLTEDQS